MADDGPGDAGGGAASANNVPRLRRRTLIKAAGGGVVALAGAGALYRGVSLLVSPPKRAYGPPPGGYPVGQYEVADYGVRLRADPESGVPVDIPPVWTRIITATLKRRPTLADQRRLAAALQGVEAAYPYSPAGVFVLVGYGLPYFTRYISANTYAAHLPRMADSSNSPVLIDAIRFASDPASLSLEHNEIVFHLRSDSLDVLHDVQRALFAGSGTLAGDAAPAADVASLFVVTSVRTGFVGAGLPRAMAQQAHLPFAQAIPGAAPLFMGFTSTQHAGQASEAAVSFDGKRDPRLPPLTTARPGDYFAGGTSLHLSHLAEDLASWYALTYEQRVARMFHYDAASRPGRVTIDTHWLNPNPSALDAQRNQVIGHNEAVQRSSRSPEGQALQLRADCNTMDALDGSAATPGVHFLAFTAGSPIFHASRQAMDAADVVSQYGVTPTANGINAFLRATRRQNFLVPPRRHRAFPLLELN